MRRKLGITIACVLAAGLVACGSGAKEAKENQDGSDSKGKVTVDTSKDALANLYEDEDAEKTEPGEKKKSDSEDGKILVAYFSATGNTEKVALMMADVLSADVYEIVPAEPYSEEDINYQDQNCRADKEQKDPSVRPEIDGTVENWDEYDTILVGSPVWWGEEPRIMDTFAESYDFTGKKVGVFCTSGGSGISQYEENLKGIITDAEWLGGNRFSGDDVVDEIIAWTGEIGL